MTVRGCFFFLYQGKTKIKTTSLPRHKDEASNLEMARKVCAGCGVHDAVERHAGEINPVCMHEG